MTTVAELAEDLRAEQDALEAVVAPLPAEQWRTPTPSPGWTVADQIGHLTYFDGTAVMAIDDPDAFKQSVNELLSNGVPEDAILQRSLSASELLAAWRDNRSRLAEASTRLDETARVPWYGPPMSAKSFLTARLMECWAHGQDVVDAVGGSRPATDRLRHIAQLGVITRGWSYANRGLAAPEGDVRVELAAPSGSGFGSGSGELWTWGPEDAGASVRGPAFDFCLVVTQRRNVADTALEVEGEIARDWMDKAQAFAGPATEGPKPRSAT